jgi:hypothetical protein
LFIDLGLALTIAQVPEPGDQNHDMSFYENNGLLWAPPAIYEDSTKIWLSGVPDNDIPASPANWIRSGTYVSATAAYNDWNLQTGAAFPWDPGKSYQKIQSGTWAPYSMCAYKEQIAVGPCFDKLSKIGNLLENIASVDIVMTPDPSKWTRCIVLEMCADNNLSEGGINQFYPRSGKSVNIEGQSGVSNSNPLYNSNYIDSVGMGWFPGYAINLETGERLNIMFGENSWDVADNGRDMLWNPTDRIGDAAGNPVFGGQHYVYVMQHRELNLPGLSLNYPAYDGCAALLKELRKGSTAFTRYAFSSAMYVGMPLSTPGKEWLATPVTIKIRVTKPYKRFYSTPFNVPDTSYNREYPMYTFDTKTISTVKTDQEVAQTDLDLINVVPNPYYAYDDYERNQLDNRIKIVNLPNKCTVTIFDMSGTMIRQYKVDKSGVTLPRSSNAGLNTEAKTSIDWDLKNYAGIPIAGGVYLIHVKADDLGERTIKWFGILRPVDLNSL